LLEQLQHSALISVAHRESLEKYHDHILDLSVRTEEPLPGDSDFQSFHEMTKVK